MDQGMRESDIEGIAIHGGPKLCVGDPRGRSEALAGERVGRAIEPRNHTLRGANAVVLAEGNIAGGDMREPSADPARSKNPCIYGRSMRENRETSPTPGS